MIELDTDDMETAEAEDLVATHGPFELRKTGAVVALATEPSYDEWAAAFAWCQNVEKASPFWVGDLLVFGERFGEEASQVLDATPYAEQTCRNAKHTCKMIPPERRRPEVSFAHHQEVAALKTVAEQDYWLDQVEDKLLSRDELRVQIRAAKSLEAGEPVDLWLMVKCSTVAVQSELADRLRLEGFSVKATATKP